MSSPEEKRRAYLQRAALIMLAPALGIAAAAAFFGMTVPLESLSASRPLAAVFPPAASPPGVVAQVLFSMTFALILGAGTWCLLFAVEYRLGSARRRPRRVQVPVRPIRPAELVEAIEAAAAAPAPAVSESAAEAAAASQPLDLAQWRIPDAQPEIAGGIPPSPSAPRQEFSFADYRRPKEPKTELGEKPQQPEAGVARLIERLEEKVAPRAPDEPHPVVHPDAPFRAQLEELKRLAMRR